MNKQDSLEFNAAMLRLCVENLKTNSRLYDAIASLAKSSESAKALLSEATIPMGGALSAMEKCLDLLEKEI